MERETVRGLGGVVEQYAQLSDALKLIVLRNIKQFHHALRECDRSNDGERRIAAMKLIASRSASHRTSGRSSRFANALYRNR